VVKVFSLFSSFMRLVLKVALCDGACGRVRKLFRLFPRRESVRERTRIGNDRGDCMIPAMTRRRRDITSGFAHVGDEEGTNTLANPHAVTSGRRWDQHLRTK